MSFVRLTVVSIDASATYEVLWPLSRVYRVTPMTKGCRVQVLTHKGVPIDYEVAEDFDEVERRLKAAARDAVPSYHLEPAP